MYHGIELSRQIELLEEYFVALAKNYGHDDYKPQTIFEGNTFTIYDPNFPDHQAVVTVKKNGEIKSRENQLLSVLFLANTSDINQLTRFYQSRYQVRLSYSDEIVEARVQGHSVQVVNPYPYDLYFCTLVCYDKEIGKYYIHVDDGDCRVSKDPRWGVPSYPVGDHVVSNTDDWCISIDNLKEQWL